MGPVLAPSCLSLLRGLWVERILNKSRMHAFLQITERDFLLQTEMTQRDNLKQAVALPFMQKPKQMEHFHVNTSVVVELFFTRMKTQKPM